MSAPGWSLPLSSIMRLRATFAILVLFTLCSKQKAAVTNREFCKETEVQGPCRAFTPRWYYDFKSNTCGLFLYGGCGGNDNNFQSKTDCLETCSGKS